MYILFAYPGGGLDDVAGVFDELEKAINAGKNFVGEYPHSSYAYVFDEQALRVVWDKDDEFCTWQPFGKWMVT